MILRSLARTTFTRCLWRLEIILTCIFTSSTTATGLVQYDGLDGNVGSQTQLVFTGPNPTSREESIGDIPATTGHFDSLRTSFDTLSAMLDALDVMQDQYFEAWQGVWPTGIDWTSAVLGTQVSAALSALSTSFEYLATLGSAQSRTEKAQENLVNRYFSQLLASYFGQDAFRLRNEAYDDILWVVLGWLESIKFIQVHSDLHYKEPQRATQHLVTKHSPWYGKQWTSAFAHRARLFWDLGAKGWDTTLCGGGMIWSPYLAPYKNAITNELFIAASISMYLYFPGDDNPSPFTTDHGLPVGPRDPKYLAAAIETYRWLQTSNMKNSQGLYVDGYHITGWEKHPKNGTDRKTKCDSRNNMVYTYNQGVILSGQRGLWEATGARSYLDDGHELIANVINATGYDLNNDKPYQDDQNLKHSTTKPREWHGIGSWGILADVCDQFGYCSQDGQTFKGIYFHHLALFCAPLSHPLQPEETFDVDGFQDLKSWHSDNCKGYSGWIRRNAKAAVKTRNNRGNYGMWWGAPSTNGSSTAWSGSESDLLEEIIDYRNLGIPRDPIWRYKTHGEDVSREDLNDLHAEALSSTAQGIRKQDANDRGRGRTVETQSGGLAVLRALWEIVELRKSEEV